MSSTPPSKPDSDKTPEASELTLELLAGDNRNRIELLLQNFSSRFRGQMEIYINQFFLGIEGGEEEERKVLGVAKVDILDTCDSICSIINDILFRDASPDVATASLEVQAKLNVDNRAYIDKLSTTFAEIHQKAAELINRFIQSVKSDGAYVTDMSEKGDLKRDLKDLLQIMSKSGEHIGNQTIDGIAKKVRETRDKLKEEKKISISESAASSYIILKELFPALAGFETNDEGISLLLTIMKYQIHLMYSGIAGQKLYILNNFSALSDEKFLVAKIMIVLNTLQNILLGIESLVKVEDILGK